MKQVRSLLLHFKEVAMSGLTRVSSEDYFRAADEGDLTHITQALDLGVDINLQDEREWTALHWASFRGDLPLVQHLIKRGADGYLLTGKGLSAAHLARSCSDNDSTRGELFELLPLSDYDERRISTDIIGQVFSCRGEVASDQDTFEVQGSYSLLMRRFLSRALTSFQRSTFSGALATQSYRDLKLAFTSSCSGDFTFEERAEQVQQRELLFLSGGWLGHGVDVCFFDGYMAVCNRIRGLEGRSTIEVFKIDPSAMDAQILREIKIKSKGSSEEAIAYLYEELPRTLNRGVIEQDKVAAEFKKIAPKPQKSGSCAFAAPESALRFALGMLLWKQQPERLPSKFFGKMKRKPKLSKVLKKAHKESKIFNHFVTRFAWETHGENAFPNLYQDEGRRARIVTKRAKANRALGSSTSEAS